MLSITPENPEYYAELLVKTSREAKRRHSFHVRAGIPGVDDPLARRLQTLLYSVASISLHEHGSIAATMASLKDNGGVLDTTLYIVFDRQRNQDATDHCRQHLESIFTMLREVPYKPPTMGGSPKLIPKEFEDHLLKISKAVHDYSFDIFEYRVLKWAERLEEIREHVRLDQTHFKPEQRTTLLTFLEHVDAIIWIVHKAQNMDKISPKAILMLSRLFSFWTDNNLLPDDLDENRLTLLDNADHWLGDKHGIRFRLRRWAVKIMSFVISANRLFLLTQSRRLRNVLDGIFSVQVLDSPAISPYCCDLSRQTIQQALNAALHGTIHLSADLDEARESFVTWLEGELETTWVEHRNPTVHAELAMLMALDKGEAKDVLPYIGVSKLSCIMCSRYIDVYNKVTGQKIATKGSHGKVFFGWSWPSLPDYDRELYPVFLQSIRQQLLEDFEQYEEDRRRKSDNSVGSGKARVDERPSVDEITRIISEAKAE